MPLGSSRLAGLAAAVICVLGAIYLGQGQQQASLVEKANQQGAAGRSREALATAERVHAPPQDVPAQLVQAHALEDLGRSRDASTMFARVVHREPANWVARRDWAVLLSELGNTSAAQQEMDRALALNPGMELPPGFVR